MDLATRDEGLYRARWAIFVIWILVILFCIFLINLRRRRRGQLPIIGTAWLAPPSYGQSQRQYNRPADDPTAIPVPEYTAQPNSNVDMGFYDNTGKFHPAEGSVPKPEPVATVNTTYYNQTAGPINNNEPSHNLPQTTVPRQNHV
ncbi:HER006Wp [Eremothecium sinecaudum]|uniref:HER006Wp n=1 Tax=Eremothecium sinecaudum TaxID=45286 RepID=A0A120K2E3_9SACH|nr:HER006Wp [Eremothecium sinecaudum]AMD21285.1 HER006Wp [Eremothecium sinecaudum]